MVLSAERERALAKLREIVLGALAGYDASVWLFGSCAAGKVRHASDIDVAILPRSTLPASVLLDLADAIEDSTIPYIVDLVDLRDMAPGFRDEIRQNGIAWRD